MGQQSCKHGRDGVGTHSYRELHTECVALHDGALLHLTLSPKPQQVWHSHHQIFLKLMIKHQTPVMYSISTAQELHLGFKIILCNVLESVSRQGVSLQGNLLNKTVWLLFMIFMVGTPYHYLKYPWHNQNPLSSACFRNMVKARDTCGEGLKLPERSKWQPPHKQIHTQV